MINSIKINLLLLPLLFAILLSIASNLAVGKSLDSLFYLVLTPITAPTSKLRLFTESKIGSLKNISVLERESREQKNQIAILLSENEYLKQTIVDKKVIENLRNSFKHIIPVRISGSTGKFIVSSSSPLDLVKPGQPLISGNVLLGTVLEVKGSAVTITPLDSEKSPSFPIRTASGQKGFYKYSDNHAQITDVPSQYPIILGDFIFTEAGELFPGNLIVGKATRITTISQEPLQKAEIVLYDTLSNNPENLAIITQP
jgi:cell shape-determining protein MreC